MWLSFMHRVGIHNGTFTEQHVEKGIDLVRKEIVEYKIKQLSLEEQAKIKVQL
jgi:hypothetical protein